MKNICFTCCRIAASTIVTALVGVMVAVGLFTYWLSHEPREVAWLSNYVLSVAEDNVAPYHIEKSSVIAFFDWDSSSILLQIKDLTFAMKKKNR